MNTRAGINAPSQPQPASQEEISETPLWHFFDYDLILQSLTLMRIEEPTYREASFLDQRISRFNCPSVRYELQHLARLFPRLGNERGPMRFIFHVGHCGSTLLSRALSLSENVLPFREPMTLRSLSADARELGEPTCFLARADWDWLLTTVIDSLARRFSPQQVNVVKATSTGNNLIAPVMDEDEHHRALLLYIPLEAYLASMLGRHARGGDLWGQARTRMSDWIAIHGDPGFALHELQAPHFAVLSWLTSMHYMLSARATYGARTRLLDFEEMLADPETHLAGTAEFFGFPQEAETINSGYPEISSAYSKHPGRAFSAQERAGRLARVRRENPDDIRAGLQWAEKLIGRTPAVSHCGEFLD